MASVMAEGPGIAADKLEAETMTSNTDNGGPGDVHTKGCLVAADQGAHA